MLKRWLLMAAIITGVGVSIWFGLPDVTEVEAKLGKPAPAFELPDLSGQMQAVPQGGLILLNFWATWCPPCRQEMPSMAELYNKFKAKGLRVVAVSVDRDASALAGFVREYNLPFQVLHDKDSKISRTYGVFRYPESYLIDAKGVIRRHLIGAIEWTSPNIVKEVEQLLVETG
ncbi:MAG: peroxiredoxin family protein [Mariprofundaceae bacterium]